MAAPRQARKLRSNGWKASALFLSPGKQKHDDAERCHNRGDSKAHSRNFGAGMKTFLELCSKPDQKKKKSQTD
jgi:hypothetical protein